MKTQKQITRSYVLTGLIIYWFLAIPVRAEEYKAAACVIFVENEVVLVRDFLSNRLSFPGGYIEPGESPQHAAARETYEEIGLTVSVGPQIGAEDQSAQFLCRSHSAIPILTRRSFEKRSIVYALSAPDFSIEIRQVYLIQPISVKTEEQRFPDQISLISDFNRYPEWQSDSVLLPRDTIPINRLHNIELNGIARFQQWLAPDFDRVFRLFNLIGENTLFFILVPVVWIYSGWQTGVRFILLLIISAELNNILKVVFALPRPFHLMPELQRMEGYGFGLPSGHVLVATVFWGYCWNSFKQLLPIQKQRPAFSLLVFLLSGCALARVYWGVHFISDVVAGAVLGILVLKGFVYLDKKRLWRQMAFAKKPPWLIGITVITITAFYTPGWLSSQLGGLTMGLFCGLCLEKTKELHKKIIMNNLSRFITAGLGIAGIFLFDQAGNAISSQQGNSMIAMLIFYVSYMLIGLWLTIGMYLLVFAKDQFKASV